LAVLLNFFNFFLGWALIGGNNSIFSKIFR
jgi:hypothetical protein